VNAPNRKPNDDTAKVIRYLAIKAAIFIGIPIIAAVVAIFAYL